MNFICKNKGEGDILHFPKEKIIIEIPIYSMPRNEFNRRWDNWKKKWYERSEQMGHSAEETEEVVMMIMNGQYPRNVWKYNQIVGFIEISIGSRDVSFNVQKTLDKRMIAVSKTKHFIQDLSTNGMHFPINKMSNEEILSKIEEYLNTLQNNLSGKMCLYLDTFNTVKRHIDYLGIRDELINY